MLVFLSVTILVLTVLVTPLMLTFKAGADLINNTGYIAVSFFFIPVFKASAQFEHLDARHNNLLIAHGRKTDEIHLNTDKNDDKSVMTFFKKVPILSAVRVRNLTFDARIGFADNAMATTLALAGVRAAFYAAAAFFKSRESITVKHSFVPEYNRNALSANVFGIISLSVANIIYSLLKAVKENA